MSILEKGLRGEYEIVGSDVIEYELYQINDLIKRYRVLDLFQNIEEYIEETEKIENRADEIRSNSNIHYFDSLHIACAEAAGADYMLTTDDRLERMSAGLTLKVKIMNPAKFIIEMLYRR